MSNREYKVPIYRPHLICRRVELLKVFQTNLRQQLQKQVHVIFPFALSILTS